MSRTGIAGRTREFELFCSTTSTLGDNMIQLAAQWCMAVEVRWSALINSPAELF